jgi:hypothetical protein
MYEMFFEIRPYSSIKLISEQEDEEDNELMSLFNLGFKVISGYRPTVPQLDYSAKEQRFLDVMVKCWDQDQHVRPSFDQIYLELERINSDQ